MKKITILSFGVLVPALALGLLLHSQKSPNTSAAIASLQWHSFSEGMSLAKEHQKKLLIDVYTDWCVWCKKMDSEVYTDPGVVDVLNSQFVLVKLNAESDKQLIYRGNTLTEAQFSQAVGVTGFPSTLFFTANGEPITLLPGYVPATRFVPILKYIGENHYQTASFDQYLSSIDKSN